MTEMMKVEVDDALARRFRKRAMERYGYKKGAIKKAVEEMITKFSTLGRVDWACMHGSLKPKKRIT
jgi:hypothetical protein